MVEHIATVRWPAHRQEMSNFVSDVKKLANREVYSDCFLKCKGGEMIPAHRVILAMASPFFKMVFRSTPSPLINNVVADQILVLEGVEASQMEILLQYIYFGYAIVKCEELPAISRIAKSLGIKEFPTLEVAPSASAPTTPKPLHSSQQTPPQLIKSPQGYPRPQKSCDESRQNSAPANEVRNFTRKNKMVDDRNYWLQRKKFKYYREIDGAYNIDKTFHENTNKGIPEQQKHNDLNPKTFIQEEKSEVTSPVSYPENKQENPQIHKLKNDDISNSSFRSLFQPEEIKVEDPDDDSPIEVCLFSDEEERQSSSGDEKNYLNYANNQGRDSFPESQPSEKNTTPERPTHPLLEPYSDGHPYLPSARTQEPTLAKTRSSDKLYHPSENGSQSVPPRPSSENTLSLGKRPKSAPTTPISPIVPVRIPAKNMPNHHHMQCHPTVKEKLKEHLANHQLLSTDVEIFNKKDNDKQKEEVSHTRESTNATSLQSSQKEKVQENSEDHYRPHSNMSNSSSNTQSPALYSSEIENKKFPVKPGPPALLSMGNDDYRKYRQTSQGILRETLIRRNPLLAVPSPTRLSISDHHQPQSQSTIHKPHPPYIPLKSIYSKHGPTPVHPKIQKFYERMHPHDPSNPNAHGDPYPSSEASLPLTLPEIGSATEKGHRVNGFTTTIPYTSQYTKAEEGGKNTADGPSSSDPNYPRYVNRQNMPIFRPETAHHGDAVISHSTERTNHQVLSNDPLLTKISTTKRKRVRGPKSWEYLLRLLRDPSTNPSLIRWENEKEGIFRLVKPDAIAVRWGKRTGKHFTDMLSYENFARGLRYHYVTGALSAVSERCFVYKFGPKAEKALKSTLDVLEMPLNEQTNPGAENS